MWCYSLKIMYLEVMLILSMLVSSSTSFNSIFLKSLSIFCMKRIKHIKYYIFLLDFLQYLLLHLSFQNYVYFYFILTVCLSRKIKNFCSRKRHFIIEVSRIGFRLHCPLTSYLTLTKSVCFPVPVPSFIYSAANERDLS